MKPIIVVCTPTRNRRWVYEFSKHCFLSQTLAPDGWIVVDNSDDAQQDWSIIRTDDAVFSRTCITYEHIPDRKPIGWLRNRCIEQALNLGADYIVFWDDDDFYPATRIAKGIALLESNPQADIVGSGQMYILTTGSNRMLKTSLLGESHSTAATWIVRSSYASLHRFDETFVKGEERTFTKYWTAKMIQMPPEDTIVVMGHGFNTIDKEDVAQLPQKYKATLLNADNGKQYFRCHWNVPWDLFRNTFSV